jgi:hypothetical protein
LAIRNTGNDEARNVKITIVSPDGYFDNVVLDAGSISPDQSTTLDLRMNFREKVLQLLAQTQIPVEISVTFQNSANQPYDSKLSASLSIYSRNSPIGPNYPALYTAWVSPHQPLIRKFAAQSTSGLAAALSQGDRDLAAYWLFQSLKSYGIAYVNDVPTVGDYVQTPLETFERKNGDCEDLAILYASMLESIGMEPVLFLIPGHMYAGYVTQQGQLVPIDTTAGDFKTAALIGIQETLANQQIGSLTIIHPDQYRGEFDEVVYSQEPTISLPSISKQIGACNIGFNLQQLFTASVDVTFSNSGNAPGAGCAKVSTYQSGQLKDSQIECWTIQPGETKTVNFKPNVDLLQGFSCTAI